MNLRRGLARAAIAFMLPWAAFWTWAYIKADDFAREARVELSSHMKLPPAERMKSDRTYEILIAPVVAEEKKTQAILAGVSYPLVVTVLFPLVLWVRRGFRPTPAPSQL